MFDSHCHPTDIERPAEVVREALIEGLQSLLACGYNAVANEKVVALSKLIPQLPVAIGVHPWFAYEPWNALQEQLVRCQAVAIGECGLDGAEDPSMPPLAVQRVVFEFQLDIAQKMSVPVTVHSRKAVTAVAEVIMGFPGVRGILHAFGGSYEQAKEFVDGGWLIGIGGAATRVGAKKIRNLVQKLPLSCIALETDAPAIGIEGIGSGNVRPAHLPLIAEAIASLRGISKEEVTTVTSRNVDSLFGFPITQRIELA